MAHLLGRVSMDTLESVLLFDPDTDTAEMYGVGLELAGFRARVTSSDAEARSVLRQERPAAVIADVGAGAAEAWELIQLLRGDRSTRDIPVVVLAGRTDPWIGRRAAALGCAALLVKPCLPDALAAAVRESLQTS
jgi:DNA-binding response OmpR family regulator